MNPLLIVLPVVVIALLVLWWLSRRRVTPDDDDSASDRLDTVAAWQPKTTRILTTQERMALGILTRALPDHIILAQVGLARFLKVPTRNSYTEWLRRLGSQCADLVVCDMATEVVAVVDVQSPAGQASVRARKRLNRMARVLKAAGIPLHVWTENALPSVEAARDTILLRPTDAAAQPKAGPMPAAVTAVVSKTQTPAASASMPAAKDAAPAGAPGNPFDDSARDSAHDERIELREPPPSTWFDEFNSGPTPLPSATPPQPPKR
jgi:Protein of unknown function (DUF2726)